MDWKAIRRKEHGVADPFSRHGRDKAKDDLLDRKLKKELMKMMLEDHVKMLNEHLPEEEQGRLAYEWMECSDELNEGND